MDLLTTPKIARKLREKHKVSESEVFQCFLNRRRKYVEELRDEHRTDPPTLWLIAQTDSGRRLKVILIRYSKTQIILKSAYEPNFEEMRIYHETLKRGLS